MPAFFSSLPAFWLYALTAVVLLGVRAPLGPRPRRRTHQVRFDSATGFLGIFARRFRHEAVPLKQDDMAAMVAALVAGVPQAQAVQMVAATIFPRRWWHRGAFDPISQLLALDGKQQLWVFEQLMTPVKEAH